MERRVISWGIVIPKCRRMVLYRSLRKHLGEVFRKLAEQKKCRIEEGHLLADHVHMMISIPPKYSVSSVAGFIKVLAILRKMGIFELRHPPASWPTYRSGPQ